MRCFSCNNVHHTELDEETGRYYCPKCTVSIYDTIVESMEEDTTVEKVFDNGETLVYNKTEGELDGES